MLSKHERWISPEEYLEIDSSLARGSKLSRFIDVCRLLTCHKYHEEIGPIDSMDLEKRLS